jgi:hypothetical protein
MSMQTQAHTMTCDKLLWVLLVAGLVPLYAGESQAAAAALRRRRLPTYTAAASRSSSDHTFVCWCSHTRHPAFH